MTDKSDELPLQSIHHLEFWVGNAKQAEYFYRNAFGFSRFAYSGPETGVRDRASYALRQGKIVFVFTTPIGSDGLMAEHIARHGDGVRDIAFQVEDAEASFKGATSRGAQPVLSPEERKDTAGGVRRASVGTYGGHGHPFVAKNGYSGPFLPGYVPSVVEGESVGLLAVDHVVGNVELGKMEEWVGYYERVFGFTRFMSFDDKDISTEYSALMSKVMSNGNGKIKFPINEPAPGKRKSQIDEYLDFYAGPGVQHIALLTGDILHTVYELKRRGVE